MLFKLHQLFFDFTVKFYCVNDMLFHLSQKYLASIIWHEIILYFFLNEYHFCNLSRLYINNWININYLYGDSFHNWSYTWNTL